jgi:uncharacterized oxidoreductase
MNLTGNTIVITGGGTGIGRGLAEAFWKRDNRVIICGRRRDVLDEVIRGREGMAALELDVGNGASIQTFARQVARDFPDTNVLINNAGIMRRENLLDGDTAAARDIVATNLLGLIELTAALLPAIRGKTGATLWNVSSGLAFVPLAFVPTYCATKAAVHSYTQSLRYQLRGAGVQVVELIPPYVATDLLDGRNDPRAMPLEAFITEVMAIVERDPNVEEILVETVKRLRFAAEAGAANTVFHAMNDALAKGPAEQP